MEEAEEKGGKKQLSYTETGELASYTDCSGKKTEYRYDGRGRLVEQTDAAGGKVTYKYGEFPTPSPNMEGMTDAERKAGRAYGNTRRRV